MLTSRGFVQEKLSLYNMTQELHGIAATIEHRYIGESLPFGNASQTTEGLRYLTLDNVMLDAVDFIDYIKSTVPGANESKAIVDGGALPSTSSLHI